MVFARVYLSKYREFCSGSQMVSGYKSLSIRKAPGDLLRGCGWTKTHLPDLDDIMTCAFMTSADPTDPNG